MSDQSVSPERILQVGIGFWASKALLSAVDLGVFTELARRPATAGELQARLGLHPRGARDFFDALVALGFLTREGGVYHNAPESDRFLDRAKLSYIGGMLEMAEHRLYPQWAALSEALRTGEPQNEIKKEGGSHFEALYRDPNRLEQFLRAMTGVSRRANMAIAAAFPWARYRTFADLGTAQGDLAVQVALAHPHLTGTGFDLPEVGPIFARHVAANGVEHRVTFTAGDFFNDPLPSVDVLMMGHILHDWNLEEKQRLLAKALAALPAGGALIVYDAVIDDDRSKNVFGLLMSLNMLIETPGGFDYTGADCIGWMKAAGFTNAYVERLVGSDSMVVGIK